jgi:hypothetical protein
MVTVVTKRDDTESLKKAMTEFVKKNDNELRKFIHYSTGIYDRDLVHDMLSELYCRLVQSKALLNYDENYVENSIRYYSDLAQQQKLAREKAIACGVARTDDDDVKIPTRSEIELASFDTYISNQLFWLMPLLAKKNFRHKYVSVSDEYVEKYIHNDINGDVACPEGRAQSDQTQQKKKKMYHEYRVVSHVSKRESRLAEEATDVFDLVSKDYGTLRINRSYEASLYDQDNDPVVAGYVEDFKQYIRRTESPNMTEKMITYLESKLDGCKGVEIAPMLKNSRRRKDKTGVSNNMVKIIRQNLQKKYSMWQGALA